MKQKFMREQAKKKRAKTKKKDKVSE